MGPHFDWYNAGEQEISRGIQRSDAQRRLGSLPDSAGRLPACRFGTEVACRAETASQGVILSRSCNAAA
jgi:hypothetical protein